MQTGLTRFNFQYGVYLGKVSSRASQVLVRREGVGLKEPDPGSSQAGCSGFSRGCIGIFVVRL